MLKKWIVGILVAGMVLMAGAAYATWEPGAIPTTGTELDVWEETSLGSGVFVAVGSGAEGYVKARCLKDGLFNGSCNKEEWEVTIVNHASVAQWVELVLTGTTWKWYVRKPGVYVADCIDSTIASNYDVKVDYEGFADLVYTHPQPPKYVPDPIPVWYGHSDGGSSPSSVAEWVRAADLNVDDDLIPDSLALHSGISWKLWNKIQVLPCHSACEYEDEATITVILQGIKAWIDTDTGGYLF